MDDSIIKKSSILIVDDQEANIDVLEGLLKMQGYTNIRTTTDSREVIGLIKSSSPDLILLDLLMPHLTGFEVMEQIKSLITENIFIPILVLTADITNKTKQRALSNGAKDFLTKPFDLIEAGLRIKNLLETKYLQKQLENQNQILEEKVKERTKELELANRELIIARDKAQKSDRLKTAFLNNISHEIRTPLNGILGFASFIIQPDITMEKKEKYLEILNLSSTRLMNTVTDIMDLSLIISGNMHVHPQQVNVSSLLKNVFMDFQESAKIKKLDFKMQFPNNADEIMLHTDKEMLYKAISKIINNSVKFTQEGSINLGFELINDEIKIFVKDTGVGIEDDAQKIVFENFMQEDISNTRGHEGSGMGLSIARGIMRLLDGEISLVSTKKVGTTVFLTLPYKILTTHTKPKGKNLTKAIEVKKMPIILIAEDDEDNYFYMEELLNKDYEITRALNGQEALYLCKKHPEINLVLMDIKMPIMNGIEATRIIKSFRNELPIIAVTAYAESGNVSKIKEAGCDDYLAKPVKKDSLISLIQKYLIQKTM